MFLKHKHPSVAQLVGNTRWTGKAYIIGVGCGERLDNRGRWGLDGIKGIETCRKTAIQQRSAPSGEKNCIQGDAVLEAYGVWEHGAHGGHEQNCQHQTWSLW